MSDALLDEPGVRITATQANIRGVVYPVDGITSVRVSELPIRAGWRFLAVTNGLGAAVVGLGLVITGLGAGGLLAQTAEIALQGAALALMPLAMGVGLLLVGAILVYLGLRPRRQVLYALRLTTGGRERTAMTAGRETVDRVRDALIRAMDR